MKIFFFILLILPAIGFSQFKFTIPYARYYSEIPLTVYKEAAGVNKIGEIAPGSDIIFIVGPGDINSYLVYRKGVIGYISKSHLLFEGREPILKKSSLVDAMIEAAKKQEDEYDTYIRTKREKDRIENALKNDKLLKAGLGVTYPRYIDGDFYCGYEISFTNYSAKTIKYIYLTLAAYNTVDDLVASKRFTLVGPVNIMEQSSYTDKYAFSGKQAISYFKIKKIEILYTNGTRKEYSGDILKTIIVD